MWRWAHTPADKQVAPAILRVIEHALGIPVYPDTRTAWHFDDKLAQLPLLRALGAPMPRTWVFWDRAEAMAWSRAAAYPVVFKLAVGAGASNVVRVESAREARRLIERAWGGGFVPGSLHAPPGAGGGRRRLRVVAGRARRALAYVARGHYPPPSPHGRPERGYAYFQEFVPGNAYDTRVSVIGERAFAYRRMNRPHDFRASGSGVFDPDPRAIDGRCVELAFALSRAGGFQSMAYDFLALDGRPVVLELSYGFVDWMVHDCPGHWTADGRWVDGPMWPEDAQVDDFVDRLHAVAAHAP
jgi:hypothetical protein